MPRHNVATLIAILQDPARSHAAHDEAVRLLGRCGEEAIPPLIALLSDPERAVRGRAAGALGRCGGKAIAPLRALLKDDDPQLRQYAVLALGSTRNKRAVRPTVSMLSDPDDEVRRRAAVALGWLGNDYAEDALLQAANDDPIPAVRDAARAALERIQRG